MTALALLFLASLAVAYAGPRVLVPAVDALDAHPLIAALQEALAAVEGATDGE